MSLKLRALLSLSHPPAHLPLQHQPQGRASLDHLPNQVGAFMKPALA